MPDRQRHRRHLPPAGARRSADSSAGSWADCSSPIAVPSWAGERDEGVLVVVTEMQYLRAFDIEHTEQPAERRGSVRLAGSPARQGPETVSPSRACRRAHSPGPTRDCPAIGVFGRHEADADRRELGGRHADDAVAERRSRSRPPSARSRGSPRCTGVCPARRASGSWSGGCRSAPPGPTASRRAAPRDRCWRTGLESSCGWPPAGFSGTGRRPGTRPGIASIATAR